MKLNRHSKPSNNLRQGKSRSQANIAGYKKRLARKPKSISITNLYEQIPEKSRRSNVALDVGRDEEFEGGGADDEEREELRARLIGENEDDEKIASEDDEELDSDAAFEETDEERFAGFFSHKKKAKHKFSKKLTHGSVVRFADVDLNEDDDQDVGMVDRDGDEDSEEEEEEEGDDSEFIDLLDVLDGKGEVDVESDSEKQPNHPGEKPSRKINDEVDQDEEDEEISEQDSDSGSDSDSDSAAEEKLDFDPSDDEEIPEALDQLNDFVSNLDVTSKKRKATGEPSDIGASTDTRARKRRFVKEKTEAGVESEFRAHSSGSKLNIDDLLAPLASQSSALKSLKSSAKVLISSSSKAKTLSAPLPQRTQERLDRQAAYEQTKEEVDKWSETMKHIREAEHLSFPLQSQSAGRASNLELTAKFKPTTTLETSIDALLKSAKLRDEDIYQTEEAMLQMNQLSVEEVAQRRSELRKMRELMFRAEIKARRVSKIKSKTYRRIKRKEKERLGEKINADDSPADEETILKKELDRARERATLKHNHTGKWARQMRNKEGLDADGRKDIEDMLARGEKLRRRIKGIGSDESEDDSEGHDDADDDDGLDAEGGLEKIKQNAFDELHKLGQSERVEGDENRKGKGVFEMKFMKDAMARKMQATNKSVDDFINEIGGNSGVGNTDDEEQENELQVLDSSSGVLVQRTGGRSTYRPSETTHHPSTPHLLAASDTSSVTLKSTDLLSPPPPSPILNRHSVSSVTSAQESNSNPWLTRDSAVIKVGKKNNEVVVQKESKALDKSKNKLMKQMRKREEEREKAKEDGVVEVSLDEVLTLPSAPSGSNSSKPVRKPSQVTPVVRADDDDSDSNSEVEVQEKALTLKGKGKANGIKAFEQRDLIALAFAGDNVVQNFEEAKRREIASDAPREVDTTIPGWGSWGGAGMQKPPPKPQRIKTIPGIDPTTRADFNKKHIIISEKRDKKAGKYLVKDLPYPYTSKAQFERAMETPLGVEWNTRVAFQRGTLPKVVKKPGVIINPLEKLTT